MFRRATRNSDDHHSEWEETQIQKHNQKMEETNKQTENLKSPRQIRGVIKVDNYVIVLELMLCMARSPMN